MGEGRKREGKWGQWAVKGGLMGKIRTEGSKRKAIGGNKWCMGKEAVKEAN